MSAFIRAAVPSDIDGMMEVYAAAQRFMVSTGNVNQWVAGHPSRERILDDISKGASYVCVRADDEKIIGAFYFAVEDEPTYRDIYGGHWLDDAPYGVVHRVASSGEERGIGQLCLDFCMSRWGNVRIDTHADNRPMRNLLKKYGFTYCGIIHIESGDQRLAYQKIQSSFTSL